MAASKSNGAQRPVFTWVRWVDRVWYGPLALVALLLMPLALVFGLLGSVRRMLYRSGMAKSTRLPVPVVVVGNLTAGGAGKTPLTLHLAQQLAQLGWRPGIVSRGYRGTAVDPLEVTVKTDPARCGDEPLLLARTSGVPVFVCRNRAAAGLTLLAAYPEVNVILCDDGLQHYRLARDIELCVVDGARGFGNRLLMPSGPLREPIYRLADVDAVIMNGAGAAPTHPHLFRMTLAPGPLYKLDGDLADALLPSDAIKLAALCGIGNPTRFFATLRGLGLQFDECPFPDHHAFTLADLPDADLILVTEKDAVKIAALPDLGVVGDKIRVLPVSARLEPDLADWLIGKLNHGRQTA